LDSEGKTITKDGRLAVAKDPNGEREREREREK